MSCCVLLCCFCSGVTSGREQEDCEEVEANVVRSADLYAVQYGGTVQYSAVVKLVYSYQVVCNFNTAPFFVYLLDRAEGGAKPRAIKA